jgi:TonB family protein
MRRLPLLTIIGVIGWVFLSACHHPAGGAAAPSQREKTGTGEEGDAHQPTGDVRPSELIKKVTPEYPKSARLAGVEGTVALQATITADGRVENVSVLRSIPELDDAAIAAVKQWKYKPATKDGRPIQVFLTLTIDFEL